MRRFWRRKTILAARDCPDGVVLHWRGQHIPCYVLRDEAADEHRCAAWLAVPYWQVEIAAGEEFTMTATILPAGCVVLPGFTVGDETAAADRWA